MNEELTYANGFNPRIGDVVTRGNGRTFYEVLSFPISPGLGPLVIVSSLQRSRPHGRAPMKFMEPVGRLSLIERAS